MTTKHLRSLINLCEARLPDVDYQETEKQVVAQLLSYNSQSYTKLAQKVQRISELEAEMTQLKEEVKAQTREDVADLFNAEDAAKTRVVETVSFILQLSKDPVATRSPKYKDILEALSEHLTPELILILENLKQTMVTVTQKSAALKIRPRESIGEGRFTTAFAKLKNLIFNWAPSYDAKLNQLKALAAQQ